MGNAHGVLQDGTSITLKIANGRIIDTLPDTLVQLDCRFGNLTELPTLPKNLVELDCRWNNLAELPKLPKKLIKIYCGTNNLTQLPTLPDTLVELYCAWNTLTELPTLPDTLKELSCGYNNLMNSESIFTCENGRIFVKQNGVFYSGCNCGMASEKAKQVMVELECYDAIEHFGL